MTTHLEIETLSNDNSQSLYRIQRMRFNGIEVITPLRALEPSKFDADIPLNKSSRGLSEIYQKFNSKRIATIQDDPDKSQRLSNNLKRLADKAYGDLKVYFIKFKSNNENPFPNPNEIGILTDVAYCFSDITPLPILDDNICRDYFPKYMEYVKTCYNTIEQLNTKPIMGILPRLKQAQYKKLIDFYLDKQITALCFDYNGRTPNHISLHYILRYLKTKNMHNNVLIYGINAKPGLLLKNSNAITANDFLSYGYGIDVLGENHVIPKLSSEYYENKQIMINKRQGNNKRIFMKSNYGYYKINSKANVSNIYPKDTKIKLDSMLYEKTHNLQKLFNMEQQAIELSKIRKRLATLDRNETILNYIEKKSHAREEIVRLKIGHKAASQIASA